MIRLNRNCINFRNLICRWVTEMETLTSPDFVIHFYRKTRICWSCLFLCLPCFISHEELIWIFMTTDDFNSDFWSKYSLKTCVGARLRHVLSSSPTTWQTFPSFSLKVFGNWVQLIRSRRMRKWSHADIHQRGRKLNSDFTRKPINKCKCNDRMTDA